MILVSYDGSADAQAAIDQAGRLSPGARAVVLTVWETFSETVVRYGWAGAGGVGFDDAERIDEVAEVQALATASEGAERATAAGLVAEPRAAVRAGDVAQTILAVAAEVDADVIVMGTRGRSAITSFLAGSVSHAVVQHADRAVLVVPSSELAQHRHGQNERASARASVDR